ncbi:Coenzyme F420 hydrogenase/dehydrogenase, beta subunit C-terminal domain [Methanosarcina sp.]|uniref:Coenzyme F420 hydrogenase/dehydrogenase, beta subunit C-terminal domain n=1 Tax=Methanosarcina sp. TaxID=2213 RepID=UPI002AB8BE8B|nr:Coenzyme F420 hydrogenase/dehydrogenase, beta subunit C-terminal domain [Methanosarcina sp.]MDY9925152.1 hypothetical protein [Methanosarcina sp.]
MIIFVINYIYNHSPGIWTGLVGSPDSWFTVLIRTRMGNDIQSKAVAAGMFETKPIGKVKQISSSS